MEKKKRIFRIKLRSLPFIIWFISILGFIFSFVLIDTSTSPESVQEMSLMQMIVLSFVAIGVISFGVGVVILISDHYKKMYPKKKVNFLNNLLFFSYVLLFPVARTIEIFNPIPFFKQLRKKKLREITNGLFPPFWFVGKMIEASLKMFILLITAFPLWSIAYFVPIFIAGSALGFTTTPVSVEGQSMEPTILAGEQPQLLSHWGHSKISHGDIVVVQNVNTNDEDGNVSYIKRVVGLPGDEIEIRNGFVYLNGDLLEEKYTAKPRSTFGGDFVKECQKVTVPESSIFMLGDNRAHSQDSRGIGFVSLDDIKQYLPMEKQNIFENRWRDSSGDDVTAFLPSFDKESYYDELNKVREENNLKPLKSNEKLEKAAENRAKIIAENGEINLTNLNDSKYSMNKAFQDVGYWNVRTQEIQTKGFYDSYDLARYWLNFWTKDVILNSEYQETGIGVYLGEVDGCTVQIIIQEFGGYVPPNYKEIDIQSWEKSVSNLQETLSGWEKCRNSNNVYSKQKDKCERIIELIRTRLSRNQQIASKMRASKWLSAEEEKFIEQDAALFNEVEELASFLNGLQW